MGQDQSKSKNIGDTIEVKDVESITAKVDAIASTYIFRPTFQDMLKLDDKSYCDKLIVLSEKAIGKHLSKLEIAVINERIKEGETETVAYMSKNDIEGLNKDDEKKAMCRAISKFYVKCAHVFSAISKTLNPVYEYMNENEIIHTTRKKDVVGNNYRMVYFNYCTRRIASVYLTKDSPEKKTKLCDINNSASHNYNNTSIHSSTLNNLMDDYGIKQLEDLYYDKFNYRTHSYSDMSEESRKQYENDVALLYKSLYGEIDGKHPIPKTFDEISLIPYHKMDKCQNDALEINYRKEIPFDKGDFDAYGKLLTKMREDIFENQQKIVGHLEQLCVKYQEPDGLPEYRLNPELTEVLLNKLVLTVRTDILNMYLSCQENFNNIKEMLRTIFKNRLVKNNENKLKQIEKDMNKVNKNEE